MYENRSLLSGEQLWAMYPPTPECHVVLLMSSGNCQPTGQGLVSGPMSHPVSYHVRVTNILNRPTRSALARFIICIMFTIYLRAMFISSEWELFTRFQCSRAAVTNYHTLSGLQQPQLILWQFSRPAVPNQDIHRDMFPQKALGNNLSLPLPTSDAPGSLGLWPHKFHLCLCLHAVSSFVCSSFFLFYKVSCHWI